MFRSLNISRLWIDGLLQLNPGALLKVKQQGGAIKTIDLDELVNILDTSSRIVDASSATLAVTKADHDGRIINLNRAAGVTATLPAATGSGMSVKFVTITAVTSNSNKIQVANSSDTMTGNAIVGQDAGDSVVLFEAAATSDTITMNGSTTGGLKGDIIELIDVATNLWSVKALLAATGTEATPFSAAV